MTVVCNINYDNICSEKPQEQMTKKGMHREFKPPETEQKKQAHRALHNDGAKSAAEDKAEYCLWFEDARPKVCGHMDVTPVRSAFTTASTTLFRNICKDVASKTSDSVATNTNSWIASKMCGGPAHAPVVLKCWYYSPEHIEHICGLQKCEILHIFLPATGLPISHQSKVRFTVGVPDHPRRCSDSPKHRNLEVDVKPWSLTISPPFVISCSNVVIAPPLPFF